MRKCFVKILILFTLITSSAVVLAEEKSVKKVREKRTVGIILGSIIKGLIIKEAALNMLAMQINATLAAANQTQAAAGGGNSTQPAGMAPAGNGAPPANGGGPKRGGGQRGGGAPAPPAKKPAGPGPKKKGNGNGKNGKRQKKPPPPPPPAAANDEDYYYDEDYYNNEGDGGGGGGGDAEAEEEDVDYDEYEAQDRLDVIPNNLWNVDGQVRSYQIPLGNRFPDHFALESKKVPKSKSYVKSSNGYEFTNYHNRRDIYKGHYQPSKIESSSSQYHYQATPQAPGYHVSYYV